MDSIGKAHGASEGKKQFTQIGRGEHRNVPPCDCRRCRTATARAVLRRQQIMVALAQTDGFYTVGRVG